MADNSAQVLAFVVGDERYCVRIDHVTEIVDVEDLTPIPNAPPAVRGVMDLRGRTTAIVDPRIVFGIDDEDDPQRVIVFEDDVTAEGRAAGWLVDDVEEVLTVTADQVDAPPADGDAVRGVVRRDGGFLIWADPLAVHAA